MKLVFASRRYWQLLNSAGKDLVVAKVLLEDGAVASAADSALKAHTVLKECAAAKQAAFERAETKPARKAARK